MTATKQFIEDINNLHKTLEDLKELIYLHDSITTADADKIYGVHLILKQRFEDELKEIEDYHNSDYYVLPF